MKDHKHRYRLFDDFEQRERPHKKKKTKNNSAIKYYMHVISESPDLEFYPGEKFTAKGNEGLEICKNAFETMLWVESAYKKMADCKFYSSIYQVKPLGTFTEHQYTNGLKRYGVSAFEIIEPCTIDDMAKQIVAEIKNKIIPHRSNPYPDFEIATIVYNNLNAHKPHVDNVMKR